MNRELDPSSAFSRMRHQAGVGDWLLALLLSAAYFVLLACTDDMGFTRDESFYFRAAKEYSGWFVELVNNTRQGRAWETFSQESIDAHWSYNPEHPVLMKTLFALSYEWLHVRLNWISASLAMRLPAMAFGGAMMGLIYLLAYEMIGRRSAALAAVLLMAGQPHWFFHSHLTCFDVPITTCWVAVIFAYWKSLDSWKWAVVAGLLWGVALTCKLNAFFIPAVLLLHWALGGIARFGFRDGRLTVPRVPLALFCMAVMGPIVLYAGWPRHWYDTFNRLAWYLNFHLTHEHYYVLYFGQNLVRPPFPVEYPFVMTGITTPLVILWVWGAGCVVAGVRWVRSLGVSSGDMFAGGLLVTLNILIPFLIIARPSTPIFGGVKHWFPALPFLCVMGGLAVDAALSALQYRWQRGVVASVLLSAIGIAGGVATWQSHPFGISYYNELVGGITGGADRMAMRQFWGYASRQSLDFLNAHVPQNGSVHWHETTGYAADMYREEGWLRDDIRTAWSIPDADYVVYEHDKGFWEFQTHVWTHYQTVSPVYVVSLHGVPLISVYENPHRQDPAEPVQGGGSAQADTPNPVDHRTLLSQFSALLPTWVCMPSLSTGLPELFNRENPDEPAAEPALPSPESP
jgi:4-amino-4-deoxy-L-arabinose transferase-like glycosyltransferase